MIQGNKVVFVEEHSLVDRTHGRLQDGVGGARQRLLAESDGLGLEGRHQVVVRHGTLEMRALEDEAERPGLAASSSSMQTEETILDNARKYSSASMGCD